MDWLTVRLTQQIDRLTVWVLLDSLAAWHLDRWNVDRLKDWWIDDRSKEWHLVSLTVWNVGRLVVRILTGWQLQWKAQWTDRLKLPVHSSTDERLTPWWPEDWQIFSFTAVRHQRDNLKAWQLQTHMIWTRTQNGLPQTAAQWVKDWWVGQSHCHEEMVLASDDLYVTSKLKSFRKTQGCTHASIFTVECWKTLCQLEAKKNKWKNVWNPWGISKRIGRWKTLKKTKLLNLIGHNFLLSLISILNPCHCGILWCIWWNCGIQTNVCSWCCWDMLIWNHNFHVNSSNSMSEHLSIMPMFLSGAVLVSVEDKESKGFKTYESFSECFCIKSNGHDNQHRGFVSNPRVLIKEGLWKPKLCSFAVQLKALCPRVSE